MLNLMKYEARRQMFSKGIILGVFFVLVAAFFGFCWKGEIAGVAITLALMTVETMIVLFFAPFELSYTFDKDMNTKQGYLLGLVPHKSTTILGGKLLMALLQSAVLYALFFTIVPFCEQIGKSKFGMDSDVIGQIVRDASGEISGMADGIEFWALLLTLWLFFACLSMFVTAIPGKGKMASLFGVVLFFAAIFLVFFLLDKIDLLFAVLKTPELVGNIVEWAYIIGIDAALFFGTAGLMDKKVSL